MILPLDDRAARDAGRTGGKASSLARLRAAGFPVPEGFVVTEPADAATAAFIASVDALAAASGPETRFAVRSSGYAEDSRAASFAGQYETILGVSGAAEAAGAVERCFASFSNSHARAYQSQRGVAGSGGAVIVQRLIPAEAAGVAFTLDPVSGARDRVVIDAARGLGAAVVGGQVTPDGFVVMKDSGTIAMRRSAGASGSIDDATIAAVASLARRVEEHEQHPVDIEWASCGGEVYLLQARPVTAVGREDPPPDWIPELNTPIDPRFPLYSSGNVSEILPGCVTPLTYSIFSRGVERAFRNVAESLGSMPDVGPGRIVIGFFFHRIYLNASYFMTAADNSPGATRDTVYEELIGPSPARHPAWTAADLRPRRFVKGLGIIARYLALQARLPRDISAVREHYARTRQRFDQDDPTAWSTEDLAAWLEIEDADFEPAVVHVRASQFANASLASLKGMTRRWLDDETGSLASSLVTGIGTLASAGPADALYQLARDVAATPALMALVEAESDDARLLERIESASDAAVTRLRDGVRRFIARFGHRGFREAELQNPSWGERPALVMGHIRQHLRPGSAAPDALAARQRAISDEAREAALARLTSWKRGIFSPALRNARAHIAAREEMKDLVLRYFDLTRRVVRAAQARLSGALDRPDDIYFLLSGEVVAALRGGLPALKVGDIVRRRRRDFDWCARLAVPKVQDGVARSVEPAADLPAEGELAGVPVSPGVVEGRARVVLDPNDAQLDPGDILVAPVTDVAWTPLFLRAAGLVVEVGGPLSHGSIVAREFGIPAVTAVSGATRQIRTGDRIRVDGGRGRVLLIARGDA